MTHPGVGPVTSVAFVLIVGPVNRFERSKQLVSYLGLNPSEHSSGGKQKLGSISKQGNPMLRGLLVEAGHTAARLDPELRQDYQRLRLRRAGSRSESRNRQEASGADVLDAASPTQLRAAGSHARQLEAALVQQ
jgi:transposase